MNCLKYFVLFVAFVAVESRPGNLDASVNCMMDYLKGKDKLDSDFSSTQSDIFLCPTVMRAVIQAQESMINNQILKKPEIKADCVVPALKDKNVVDDLILRDVVLTSNDLNEEKRTEKFNAVQRKLKQTFEDAAKDCESDPTYGNLFDTILGIKNETLAVLTENYCAIKFIQENKIINIVQVNPNPNNIDTSGIDCDAIIENLRKDQEKTVRDQLKGRRVSQSVINCIVQKQKASKVFENGLALKINDQLDIPLTEKKTNVEIISSKMEALGNSLVTCFFGK